MRKILFILYCIILIGLMAWLVFYFNSLYLDWKEIYEATQTIRNLKLMEWYQTLLYVVISFSLFIVLNFVLVGITIFINQSKDVLNYLISALSAVIIGYLYYLFSKDLNSPKLITYVVFALPYLFSMYEIIWYLHFQSPKSKE